MTDKLEYTRRLEDVAAKLSGLLDSLQSQSRDQRREIDAIRADGIRTATILDSVVRDQRELAASLRELQRTVQIDGELARSDRRLVKWAAGGGLAGFVAGGWAVLRSWVDGGPPPPGIGAG